MRAKNSEGYERVLSFFPNARGVGFAYMEGPITILDKGVYKQDKANNVQLMKRIKALVKELQPERILLEEIIKDTKSMRVSNLIKEISRHAKTKNIPVTFYSREQIQFVFSIWTKVKKSSKYEIAKVISDYIKPMQFFFYNEPKYPKGEPHFASLFHAVSIGISHFYVTT